jgi:hypothetical protein
MTFPCLLCHGNILETLDVPSEVGGCWICSVCHDAAVNVEFEHYSVTCLQVATLADIFTSDESEEDPTNLCIDCGIVLDRYYDSIEHNYCCRCHDLYAASSEEERTGSSEDDIGSSTEAPPDNEQCLEEDIDATSDYNRSEELYSVEGLPADHEESLCPEDEDEEKSIQESQQDHDEVEPTLKRSRH